MDISMDAIHVGAIGDSPVTLVMDDKGMTDTVNMNIDGRHYRVDILELEKMVKTIKMLKIEEER